MSTLINKSTAAKACDYSEAHIMRLAKQGRFPQPIRLGNSPQHAVRFLKSEIDAWIAERVAERDQRVVANAKSNAGSTDRTNQSPDKGGRNENQ